VRFLELEKPDKEFNLVENGAVKRNIERSSFTDNNMPGRCTFYVYE